MPVVMPVAAVFVTVAMPVVIVVVLGGGVRLVGGVVVAHGLRAFRVGGKGRAGWTPAIQSRIMCA